MQHGGCSLTDRAPPRLARMQICMAKPCEVSLLLMAPCPAVAGECDPAGPRGVCTRIARTSDHVVAGLRLIPPIHVLAALACTRAGPPSTGWR